MYIGDGNIYKMCYITFLCLYVFFFKFGLIIGNVRSCNLFEIGLIILGLINFYDIGLIIFGISIGLITFCLIISGLIIPAPRAY